MTGHATALAAFKAAFADKAPEPLAAFLSDAVVLKPPTYAKVWTGKARVARLLTYAAANIDSLAYGRTYVAEGSYALYFQAEIGGITFTGVDLVTFDADGLIREIEILARPPKAVAELSARMGASIAGDPLFQAYNSTWTCTRLTAMSEGSR